jgi:hypothetical protein
MANFGSEKRWYRPSIMAFSDSLPTLNAETGILQGTFNYLTDDNRSSLQISFDRIEYRQRMINGRMRSYHVADKKTYSVSWTDLASRSIDPNRKTLDFISEKYYNNAGTEIVNNVFMAADEMLEWYEDHPGEFYMILSYDKQHAFGDTATDYNKITYACEIVPVFFDSFSYSIDKRGQYNDLWSVSMTLVEA